MRKTVATTLVLLAASLLPLPESAALLSGPCGLGAVVGEAAIQASTQKTVSPEWSSLLPADTAFVLAVEDVECLTNLLFPPDPSKAKLPSVDSLVGVISEIEPDARPFVEAAAKAARTFFKSLRSDLACGVVMIDKSPTLLLVANLKPEVTDIRQFLSQSIQPALSSLGIESAIREERGALCLQMRDFSIFFAVSGPKLFVSTNADLLLRVKEGKLSPDSSLSSQQAFQKAIAVAPPQGVFFYAPLHALVLPFPQLASGGTPKALANLGLAQLESVALAANLDGSSLNLAFALTNSGEFTALPAILARPNTPTRAAKFVPPDYSLFKRFSTAGAPDAYREWQATVRRMVDDVTWKEYQDALANLNKQRGFSFEEVLELLGDEVAVAVKFPELFGIPPSLLIVSVKDEAKALDLVGRALKHAGADLSALQPPEGPTIYATSLIPKVLLSYTARDGYLIFGLDPSSVARAIQASKSGKSLAQDPAFASALNAAPKENLAFAYADMQPIVNFAATLYLRVEAAAASAVMAMLQMFGTYTPTEAATLAQAVQLEYKSLGHVVFYATSGKDYLSAQVRVPLELISMFSPIAQKELVRSIAHAREKARRAQCRNNLGQIALACNMYSQEHDGKFPERLSQLQHYVGDLRVFVCPATDATISRPEDMDSMSSYKLIGGFTIKEVKNTTEKLLLYESVENHKEGANVAFADSHVEWVSSEELKELLKKAGL